MSLEDGDGLGRVEAQRAAGVFGAVGGEVVERLPEGGRLVDVGLDRVGVRVDGAVEDHRPHLVREGLRAGRADPRAVRVAQVGQLRIAQRGPQHVEVLTTLAVPTLARKSLPILSMQRCTPASPVSMCPDAGGGLVDLRVGSAGVAVLASELHHKRRVDEPTRARVEPTTLETLPAICPGTSRAGSRPVLTRLHHPG